MVADIDQLILLLSIPKMQNPGNTMRGEFEPESILIIISRRLMHIEKEGKDYRLYALLEAGF
jgi:hypothetical protein